MIRPEVLALMRRWREAIAGTGAIVFGLWLWLASSGLPTLFGLAAIAVGVVLLVAGLRLGRFRNAAQAPGVVNVVEGQITYMGPLAGGAMAIDALAEVAFRRLGKTEGFWRLTATDGKSLMIPEGALGSDALLDALAPLPGFDGGEMVRAVRGRTDGLVIVWQRPATRALT